MKILLQRHEKKKWKEKNTNEIEHGKINGKPKGKNQDTKKMKKHENQNEKEDKWKEKKTRTRKGSKEVGKGKEHKHWRKTRNETINQAAEVPEQLRPNGGGGRE